MEKRRNKIIAENIRNLIRKHNINQKTLAEEIGIKQSTLSDYLNLRSNPSHGVIQKMADYFNVLKNDIDTTYKEESNLSNIEFIFNQLDTSRQNEILNFAKYQLNEQNKTVDFSDCTEGY